jgi:iron complex outermembrane recepter protein
MRANQPPSPGRSAVLRAEVIQVANLSSCARSWIFAAAGGLIFVSRALAQQPDSLATPGALKKLSLEQLMAIEVSSVSRRPERLSETASAIQVITRDEIRRSGATRLPEALRLATNLEVDQLDASQWAISARGFNSPLANKLLVLIDGRTVYSPLFAGVFWDAQDVLLEDIEQIEVISGPGATLWGANAVNGVINISTRKAKDTQGLLALGGGGNELHGFGGARYGARIGTKAHFRVYGKYSDRDGTARPDGQDIPNDWTFGQGGLRLDWDATTRDLVTLQGDLYDGRTDQTPTTEAVARGANAIGRWSHEISAASDLQVQVYVDRVHRDVPGSYDDVVSTYDLDFQHRIAPGRGHDVVWGAGYRLVRDDFGSRGVAILPEHVSLETFSAFAQDEIALRNHLHLTVGTKIEHDPYTDFEFQPSIRLAWQVRDGHLLWAAVSRAVRTPSRLDRDLAILPGPDFNSEHLVAYELGYRGQASERLSYSVAAFYHDYDDLRSVELANPPNPFPATLANGQAGKSYGVESTARLRLMDWWQAQVGYTELRVDIHPKPGSRDQTFGAAEAADSKHHLSVRSSFDLPRHLELDAGYRYVSRITNPNQAVPGYSELDLRLAWLPRPKLELSVVGQNLLHARHVEFGAASALQAIERGVYAKAVWRY